MSAPDVVALDGARIDPLAGPAGGLALFVFLSEGCPIARAMSPEIERLGRRALDAGVAVALVYPDPFARVEEIRAHQQAFGLSLPAIRDPRHDVVNAVGATISPEAALVRFRKDGGFDLVYRGRINDLYAAPGRRRPAATSRDLETALAAVLAGRAPDPARTEAVGCIIEPLRETPAAASPTANTPSAP